MGNNISKKTIFEIIEEDYYTPSSSSECYSNTKDLAGKQNKKTKNNILLDKILNRNASVYNVSNQVLQQYNTSHNGPKKGRVQTERSEEVSSEFKFGESASTFQKSLSIDNNESESLSIKDIEEIDSEETDSSDSLEEETILPQTTTATLPTVQSSSSTDSDSESESSSSTVQNVKLKSPEESQIKDTPLPATSVKPSTPVSQKATGKNVDKELSSKPLAKRKSSTESETKDTPLPATSVKTSSENIKSSPSSRTLSERDVENIAPSKDLADAANVATTSESTKDSGQGSILSHPTKSSSSKGSEKCLGKKTDSSPGSIKSSNDSVESYGPGVAQPTESSQSSSKAFDKDSSKSSNIVSDKSPSNAFGSTSFEGSAPAVSPEVSPQILVKPFSIRNLSPVVIRKAEVPGRFEKPTEVHQELQQFSEQNPASIYPYNYSFFTYFYPSETDDALSVFRHHVLASTIRRFVGNDTRYCYYRQKHQDAFLDRRFRRIEVQTNTRIHICKLDRKKLFSRALPRRRVIIFGWSHKSIVQSLTMLEHGIPEIIEHAVFHRRMSDKLTQKWANTGQLTIRSYKGATSFHRKPLITTTGHRPWHDVIIASHIVPPVTRIRPDLPTKQPYFKEEKAYTRKKQQDVTCSRLSAVNINNHNNNCLKYSDCDSEEDDRSFSENDIAKCLLKKSLANRIKQNII